MQIKPDQSKYNSDRLVGWVRILRRKRIHRVLMDERGIGMSQRVIREVVTQFQLRRHALSQIEIRTTAT
jgi:hypothetical protein